MTSRRKALKKVGASIPVVLSGCLSTGGPDPTYVELYNYLQKEVSGELTLLKDGEVAANESFKVNRHDGERPGYERFDDLIKQDGTHTVEVTLSSGRSASKRWDVPQELETALRISVKKDTIEFIELNSASD